MSKQSARRFEHFRSDNFGARTISTEGFERRADEKDVFRGKRNPALPIKLLALAESAALRLPTRRDCELIG